MTLGPKEEMVGSPDGRVEAEALLSDLLPFAKRMLATHGEFFPFGGFMTADGSIVHTGAIDPSTDKPASAALVESLTREFRRRAKAGEIRATALVMDMRVTPPGSSAVSDAIQVSVEHRSSFCADVFFPYRLTTSGLLEFGEAFAQEGARTIFL